MEQSSGEVSRAVCLGATDRDNSWCSSDTSGSELLDCLGTTCAGSNDDEAAQWDRLQDFLSR